jgi:hypothetical protein
MEVFFSYAHEDEALRDKLAKHLKLLERQGVITAWHDRDITAGGDGGTVNITPPNPRIATADPLSFRNRLILLTQNRR